MMSMSFRNQNTGWKAYELNALDSVRPFYAPITGSEDSFIGKEHSLGTYSGRLLCEEVIHT